LQGKGLAYQRYPFLILAIALCFLIAKQQIEQGAVGEVFGLTLLAIAAFWFAPTMLHRILGFQNITPFESALAVSLERKQLVEDGSVQCLDTFDGCLTALYDLKIVQPTGYLYDCYLFTDEGPVRDSYRREFLQSLKETRPRAIVVTDQHCFDQHDGFRRVETWPELFDLLAKNYSLQDSWVSNKEYRLWGRPETRPAFRVYILRSLAVETK
jgi:hypothetical protein